MTASITDLQNAIAAQTTTIAAVGPAVAAEIAAASQPIDYSAEVQQIEANTAAINALVPAAPASGSTPAAN